MKRTKDIFIRTIPVLMVMIVTMLLSNMLYANILVREEETSMQQLDAVALSMAEKVELRFTANINLMERVADAIILKSDQEQQDSVLEYLGSVRDATIFERIDILFPDYTVLYQTGERKKLDREQFPYEEVARKGSHISARTTDNVTGKEVIYLATSIIVDGVQEGVLIGVIDCQRLPEIFKSYVFEGTAQIYLVDRNDGKFLMDNWHETLLDLETLGQRELLEGYKDIDFVKEVQEGKDGRVAYYSKTNGKATYLSYTPVKNFPFSVAIAAQEDVVLENVHELYELLVWIARAEGLLLVIYLLWNLFITSSLIQKEENLRNIQMEQETNAAKSLFLSSVSHDIRTPLNGILGMLDVIKHRGGIPEQLDEDLNKIRVSAEYLVSLANNVLDLNELETGNTQLVNESIDMKQMVEELEVIMQSRTRDKHVSYQIVCSEMEHPYVLGSSGYLHRILTNLISNAIKYNKEDGQIWVTIDEVETRQDSSLYRFVVRDTGIGMSDEFREKMFSAFVQEQAGARSGNTGHGLGLAIVDRMVKKMGGTITVESEKGVGSTFTIILPFHWDLDVQKETGTEQEPSETADLTGAEILLAEDNELNMEIARILLTGAGASITCAVNGRKAVEAFQNSPLYHFDAVLMDVMMPEMDGCEAALMIRGMEREDAVAVPIIAMTASAFAEDIKRCKDSGMNEHVGKPLDMNTLIAMVSKYRTAYRNSQNER